MSKTIQGLDGKLRCRWCGAAPEFLAYHDTEWGFPVDDDHRLFEKLCLESFQSSLSWRTILVKRENFRAAFHGFDFDRIARFKDKDRDRLLNDDGIVRHRGKIEAVINNAKRAQEMVAREGSLASFIWFYGRLPISKPASGAAADLASSPASISHGRRHRACGSRAGPFSKSAASDLPIASTPSTSTSKSPLTVR